MCFFSTTSNALLIVGPEGDFTPDECKDIVNAGAIPVSLGNNRLRVETAAIALLAFASMYFEAEGTGRIDPSSGAAACTNDD